MSMTGRCDSRAAVIRRVTRSAIDAGAMSLNRFAERVCEGYVAHMPISERTLPIRVVCESDVARFESDRAANLKYVQRLASGDIKQFPADIEDAWIDAMPEPFRGELDRALSERRGLLAVRAPGAAQHAANLAEALARAGECTVALAPIFSNGTVDAQDLPYFDAAMRAIHAQQSSLSSIAEQIRQVMGLARARASE